MDFRENVVNYFKLRGVEVSKVEQQGDIRSIVLHIKQEDNNKFEVMRPQLEKDLDVVAILSNNFGMNVVIVEDNNLE